MFVRDFQALVALASCFTKGDLVIREAGEDIGYLQMSLHYLRKRSVAQP